MWFNRLGQIMKNELHIYKLFSKIFISWNLRSKIFPVSIFILRDDFPFQNINKKMQTSFYF